MPKASGNPDQFVLYDGEIVLEFDEPSHVYTLNGNVVPSTTQISKAGINKEFLLMWASSSASKYIEKQWKPGRKYTQETINNILKRGKFAYKRIQDKATTIGTNAHEWIEDFVNDVMQSGNPAPNLDYYELPHSMEAINSVAAFLTWYNDHDVVFLHSEKKVYSREHNFSGTFDLLCLVDGVLTMVDFKTSKDIYEDYFVQGSAYIQAYHEELLHKFDSVEDFLDQLSEGEVRLVEQFMVLQIPKDGKNYKTGTIGPEMYDHYFSVFKACRVIYDWSKKPEDNPWGDGSLVKPNIVKGKGKPGIYFPEYQS